MRETKFQSDLIKRLRSFIDQHGFVINMDGNYIQGFPDILILYKDTWAVLECKRSKKEPYQPNQEYYLEFIGEYVFSMTIHPGNEDEVIYALQQALRIR